MNMVDHLAHPVQNGDGSAATLADRLSALADPLRLRLCRLLEQHELSVGEVAKVVQLPQSTVSRRLKGLADVGWLAKRAEGTATYYRLSPGELSDEARTLWQSVRSQLTDHAQLREDDRRLQTVLAERRTDSLAFFGRVGGEWNELRADLFGRNFTAPALLSLLDPEWVVADLGCGTGDAAVLLAPNVKQVIAVDQTEAMLDAARRRLADFDNVEFRQGHLESLPLDDQSLDAVVCALVLHHLEEPSLALAEMRRVLRPGGAALIIDMIEHNRDEYRHTMGHKHLGFSDAAMRAMFNEAGFVNNRIQPLATGPDAKGPGLFVASARRPKDASPSRDGEAR